MAGHLAASRVQGQLSAAVRAVVERDAELAARVRRDDSEITWSASATTAPTWPRWWCTWCGARTCATRAAASSRGR